MKIIYQIKPTRQQTTIEDWQQLHHLIAPFVSSYTIHITIKNNIFYLYLLTDKIVDLALAKHNNFLFWPSRTHLNIPSIGWPNKIKLPTRNLFDLIEEAKIKHSYRFVSATLYWHKYPLHHSHINIVFSTVAKKQKAKRYLTLGNPNYIFNLNFKKHRLFILKKEKKFINPPQIGTLTTSFRSNALFKINLFPYQHSPVFLPISKIDFHQHSLIVGQTGTGKSTLVANIASQLCEIIDPAYSVVLLDPHATLAETLKQHLTDRAYLVDFIKTNATLFPSSSPAQIATELTVKLFKTLLTKEYNPYLERLLKYSLFTLYSTNKMSLNNIVTFLTNQSWRSTVVDKIRSKFNDIAKFFDNEFFNYETQHYDTAFMPIISLIEGLNFLPNLKNNSQAITPLEEIVNKNPVTLISLDRLSLGDVNTKLLSGLLTQQLFLLAQMGRFKKPVLFIVDEAAIVENQAFGTILSQARKFNLSLLLIYQYLSQAQAETLQAIQSNIYNYFCFKVSHDDALFINNAIDIKLDYNNEENKDKQEGSLDSKVKLLTTLNPYQAMVRLFYRNKFWPVLKAETLPFPPNQEEERGQDD